MKQSFSFSVVPVLGSCLIGMAVACMFNVLVRDPWQLTILKGALSGSLIGVFAEAAFIATARWINRKPFLSFIAVFCVIAVGTGLFVRFFMSTGIAFTLAVVVVSESIGLTATFLFWRYSRNMNRRLEETKKHFTS